MNPHKMTTNRPTRDRYAVTLGSPDPHAEPVTHTVEIAPADQLRGEIIGHQEGLGPMSEVPLNYTVVWMYCSLVRTGLYGEDWQTFLNRDLYAWGSADDTAGGEGDQDPMPGSAPLEFG